MNKSDSGEASSVDPPILEGIETTIDIQQNSIGANSIPISIQNGANPMISNMKSSLNVVINLSKEGIFAFNIIHDIYIYIYQVLKCNFCKNIGYYLRYYLFF